MTVEKKKIDFINWLIRFLKVDTNGVSDGYHTFGELYEHRCWLYANLLNNMQDQNHATGEIGWYVWKSRKHDDDSEYKGWFIAGISRGEFGDITYHLPISMWDKVVVPVLDKAPKWDGHTPSDVLERLKDL